MSLRPSFGLRPRYASIFIVISLLFLVSLLLTPATRPYVAPSTSSAFHPSKWLPSPIANHFGFSNHGGPEFDENGGCLFLSPFDALSKEEKAKAERVQLEQVSKGIVRAKASSHKSHAVTNPILGLLEDGERKWKDMLATQSQTLEQAVDEYKSRHHRNPPKGFDLWWRFATERGVLLPDEYDAIHTALLPFWAFSPQELIKRNAEAEKVVETFTLVINDGTVELQWNDEYSKGRWWASGPRADAQINLMEPFLSMLPNLRATFTVHDQPSILPSFERMNELTNLAKQNKHTHSVDEEDMPKMDWVGACPPDSPARQHEDEPEATDTFVSSHSSAMDFCQHPSILENHGMALEVKGAQSQPKPHTRLLPVFVPSRTGIHADIPITPVGKDGRRDAVGSDPEWKKKSDKLYWRGLATGIHHNKKGGAKWPNSHRERLHRLANNASFAPIDVLVPLGTSGATKVESIPANTLSQYYMDVAMSKGPWQCDGNDGTCKEMEQQFTFASEDPSERSNEFKYVFDTDGNAWSSRFPRLMASNNVVIKASIFPEWNTHSLPEWYAYVPTKMDYSDLWSILAFFRGTPKGTGGHDEVARRIAKNGQCWVERTWRREDMQAYMFRLYLEWARLTSPNRDTGEMDYQLPERHLMSGELQQ